MSRPNEAKTDDESIQRHSKPCEYCSSLDDDYCSHCGEPHGAMRDMLMEEIAEELRESGW